MKRAAFLDQFEAVDAGDLVAWEKLTVAEIKQQEMASKQGENPAVAAARAQQEMEAKRMAQGLMAAQKQQELRHKDMAHQQKLTHAEQMARQKAALAAQNPQPRKIE